MVKERGLDLKVTGFIKILSIIIMIILFILIFFLFLSEDEISKCGDGTFEGNCSLRKPYFCSDEVLVEKASVCGCPKEMILNGDECVSEYQTNPKNIFLNYILRGEKGEINFLVYGGLYNYISEISKTLYFSNGKNFSRQDLKSKKINDDEQRKLILPLVTEIQNIAKDETDQVRIAVSLVQRIPYKESDKSVIVGLAKLNHSRYAYEVLYEMQGACEGRSELLAFLLKEMGYGVVLFYFPLENHEAVGIKCPIEKSFKETGYCFVETTGSSIISNSQEYYSGGGRLESEAQIIFISDGKSLDKNLYEYSDAKIFAQLSEIVKNTGELNIFRHYRFKSLKEKYGLNLPINL